MKHINYILGSINCITFTVIGCLCLFYHIWLGAAVCLVGFIFASKLLMRATNGPR